MQTQVHYQRILNEFYSKVHTLCVHSVMNQRVKLSPLEKLNVFFFLHFITILLDKLVFFSTSIGSDFQNNFLKAQHKYAPTQK